MPLASVDFLLKRGQVFWSQYCNRGRLTLAAPSGLSFVARMEDFPGSTPSHCHLIEGWLEGPGRHAGRGGNDLRPDPLRPPGRSPLCEYLGVWTSQRGEFLDGPG